MFLTIAVQMQCCSSLINVAFNEPCIIYEFLLFIYLFFNISLSLFLQDTELLVLGCLKWDVSCVTPLDFIDLIISRLPIINKNCADIDPEKIRKHAQAFISLAVRGEFKILFFLAMQHKLMFYGILNCWFVKIFLLLFLTRMIILMFCGSNRFRRRNFKAIFLLLLSKQQWTEWILPNIKDCIQCK